MINERNHKLTLFSIYVCVHKCTHIYYIIILFHMMLSKPLPIRFMIFKGNNKYNELDKSIISRSNEMAFDVYKINEDYQNSLEKNERVSYTYNPKLLPQ